MPVFIKLENEVRKNLFYEVKAKIDKSWDKFYPELKISRGSFFNYLSGRGDIPEEVYLQLLKISKIDINNIKRIIKDKYSEKSITKPSMSNLLAEILGVINGDGHVNNTNYEISIVGNRLEEEYYLYLDKLLERILKLKFRLTINDSAFKLRTYSKNMVIFLNSEFGLPFGNKIGKLKIPKKVLKRRSWILSYLRGLFDTDGCFHIRREKDPMLSIASADKRYLGEVKKTLENFGFHVVRGQKRIFIYQKDDIKRFFKEVKPANSKHLKKYQI